MIKQWQVKHIELFDILNAAKIFHSDWEILIDSALKKIYPDCPDKVIYRAIENAVDKGYLEYGTSCRSSWLTDKGKKNLKELANE